MINYTLFKQSLKSHYKTILIFISILTLYTLTIISMYDPESISLLEEFSETMPEMMALFGMNNSINTLIGFLITYLYGFIFLIIPLIVTIIVSNKLIAYHVDKGSMVYLLSSPNNRNKIIRTQLCVLYTIIFVIMIYCTILTIVSSSMFFPKELDISSLLLINFHLFVFHIFLGSISFLASTIFNETRLSLMFGAGIPLIFYLIEMLANIGGKLENLKYFTIFSLFQPFRILNNENIIYLFIIILLITIIFLNFLAVNIFKNKDLSI